MARHRPVPVQIWQEAQRHELARWQAPGALEAALAEAEALWLPRLAKALSGLSRHARILEVGPGPVCLAARLGKGKVTFVDPLAEDYRRLFPGRLPERARFIAQPIEKAKLPHSTFDAAILIRAIDRVHNPEIALAEIHQALVPGGLVLVGNETFPKWRAMLHYLLLQTVPRLAVRRQLYRFTAPALRKTLARRFWITEAECVRRGTPAWAAAELWWFVAEKPEEEEESVADV